MENEVMMNEVMEEAIEAATRSPKGFKNVLTTNFATGVAVGCAVGAAAVGLLKKGIAWAGAKIKEASEANAAKANTTTDSTDVEVIE